MPRIVQCSIQPDEITDEISRIFDYTFEGVSSFTLHNLSIDKPFKIGLIVGASGSGKSLLLKDFGEPYNHQWDPDKAVISHFINAKEATDALMGVGFNSIPSWMKPYHVLSNGEKYRVDLAINLKTGAVVDEFTSVVDRNVAKSCANAVHRYIHQKGLESVVFASCHFDIIEWLRPDWVYDTDTRVLSWGLLQRPPIHLSIESVHYSAWAMFANHHYLTEKLNNGAKCFVLRWDDTVVGFASVLAYPSGTVKNAYREHRTVILPDFQGLGLGVKLSDMIAEYYVSQGKRYFSKTSHPRFGQHRETSSLWRATSKNKRIRNDYNHDRAGKESVQSRAIHRFRNCFSHEYVGANHG